ncbi:protein of unknown function [Bartonella clarridgeiae 73]|uniref:Uncharacterized protein n=1 Tax=Bartonella clarridgeiae (strain CCUG 45776 / CIP 104772 / 73) TaxID=696125 RepID=E6YI78_BARC7|nr:protein of unknown function [Bartonella clarridgeiae 73]
MIDLEVNFKITNSAIADKILFGKLRNDSIVPIITSKLDGKKKAAAKISFSSNIYFLKGKENP